MGSLWASGLSAHAIGGLAAREELDLSEVTGSWQGLYSSEPMRSTLEAAFRGEPSRS